MVAATPAIGKHEAPADILHRNFQAAVQELGLEPDLQALLAHPIRRVRAELPVRMDDGSLGIFSGYRVQHNDVRGPFLGGLRLQSQADLEDLPVLAALQTWRCAVANVPFGGAQGAIACDPKGMSAREIEAVVRKYAAGMHSQMGAYRDVVTPDLRAGEKVMAWIANEYEQMHVHVPAAVLGKPAHARGLPCYAGAVGCGIKVLIGRVAEQLGLPLQGLRVAVQGFGTVGSSASKALAAAGCSVVAVSDSRSAIYHAAGIDIDRLVAHKQSTGSVAAFSEAESISHDALLECDCDALIPAALACVLTARNAARVQARMVLEAANISITSAADSIFQRRGIVVIPDILANAGAVIAAHIEWSQNLEQVVHEEGHVRSELEKRVLRAYEAVARRACDSKRTLREAAYLIALQRVASGERLRTV